MSLRIRFRAYGTSSESKNEQSTACGSEPKALAKTRKHMERSSISFFARVIAAVSTSVCSWMAFIPGRNPFSSAEIHSRPVAVLTSLAASSPENNLYKEERSEIDQVCGAPLFVYEDCPRCAPDVWNAQSPHRTEHYFKTLVMWVETLYVVILHAVGAGSSVNRSL